MCVCVHTQFTIQTEFIPYFHPAICVDCPLVGHSEWLASNALETAHTHTQAEKLFAFWSDCRIIYLVIEHRMGENALSNTLILARALIPPHMQSVNE